MITLQEQIAEAKRELALRKNLYPQWVTRGTLDAGTAGLPAGRHGSDPSLADAPGGG